MPSPSWIIINGQIQAVFTAGIGSQGYRPSGLLYSNVTASATGADQTLTIFASYTMPANTVSKAGDALRITAWGKFGATANTKNVFLTIGGDGIRSMTSAGNNVGWYLQSHVVRITSGNYDTSQGTGFVDAETADVGTPTNQNENFATDLAITCKGQNGTAAANDITFEGMLVELIPAVS